MVEPQALSFAIADIEEEYLLALKKDDIEQVEISRIDKTSSDLDNLDIAWCLLCSAASVFLSTNKAVEKWLDGIHNAASDCYGDYDFIQKALGEVFHHKSDWMDKMTSRDSDETYVAFHRLLWGHDPLAKGEGLANLSFNPIKMMMQQEESERSGRALFGAVQAMRHLLADTFSKQGLPLPGLSYLDYERSDGKTWNHIIDVVQELSVETTGNKSKAEELYRHLFTLRAQDIAGGTLAIMLTKAYIASRQLEDTIRINQIKLVSYSTSFFGQAIVGAVRQKGVPYINYPLAMAMIKELAGLFYESNRRTYLLGKETERLHGATQEQLARHDRLQSLI